MNRDAMISQLEAIARTSDADIRARQAAWPHARAGVSQVAAAIRAGHPDPIPLQPTPELSTLAAKVLSGSHKPTRNEINSLAGFVLAADTTKGQE